MKRMMLTGGLTGFALATLSGLWSAEADWPRLLLRASVAALAGGLLARWWAGLAARCLAQARLEREATAAGSSTAAAPGISGAVPAPRNR